jgi:septum site-determining protein MinC
LNTMADTVAIKGTSEGLVISLGEGPLGTVLEEMDTRLGTKASFFVGGRVALRVGDRNLSAEQLQTIGNQLEAHGVTLWAVESEHPGTCAAAQELGLETNLHPAARPLSPVTEQIPREELTGLLVRRTLRSGQAIRHAGHVTLIGDVNPGAEIVAAGDIVVWGRLRGIAHAGAMGDEEAIICALELAPSQIRISSHVARPPERSRSPRIPEFASVQDDRIIVERWAQSGWSLVFGKVKLELGG